MSSYLKENAQIGHDAAMESLTGMYPFIADYLKWSRSRSATEKPRCNHELMFDYHKRGNRRCIGERAH